jgi:hypothetical protein
MGCWDIFCFICGNNCNNLGSSEFSEQYPEYGKLFKKLNWKKNCSLLLLNNEVVHDCIERDCNVGFENVKTGDRYTANYNIDIDYFSSRITNYGIYLHTDCWKYIKKSYGIELKYADLPAFNLKLTYEPLNINYGDIKKYWGQDLDYQQMFLDKKIYMAFSPLESDNSKNITRIKKIVSQLKLKKEARKGPSVSATFYPNKTIKLGNNNLFWEKKNGKWVELSDKPIIKLFEFITVPKNKKKINNIPQIGQNNTIPLFVNNFYIQNKKYYIEFIGSEKIINDLSKKIKN